MKECPKQDTLSEFIDVVAYNKKGVVNVIGHVKLENFSNSVKYFFAYSKQEDAEAQLKSRLNCADMCDYREGRRRRYQLCIED
ncbi:hypothetical protein Plhal304r1_c042g0121081 [Plasmopara halstedii]